MEVFNIQFSKEDILPEDATPEKIPKEKEKNREKKQQSKNFLKRYIQKWEDAMEEIEFVDTEEEKQIELSRI